MEGARMIHAIPDSTLDLNQTSFLPIEGDWKEKYVFMWLQRAYPAAWVCACAYILTILALRKFMEHRRPFELRRALVLWSGTLAIFSAFGAARTVPERVHVVSEHGWSHSVCYNQYYTGPIALWNGLFVLSKVYEFGDTIFIILRKQKLIFLHWYHHATVLLFSWYMAGDSQVLARWFCALNYFVHTVMYSYYTLRALKIRVPKMAAMFVTVLQILQMALGIAAVSQAYFLMRSGRACNTTFFHLYVSFGIYGSYFLLFGHFFYKSYMGRGARKSAVNGVKKIE